MFVREILHFKGTEVHTIGPDATVADAVDELVRYNVGSLVVCESHHGPSARQMIGIITERDILRARAVHRIPLDELAVAAVMSTEPLTTTPNDPLEDAMQLMTYRRVRHLPVVDGDELLGIISIGDIVKAHHDQLAVENHYMKSYIQGEGAEIGTQ